MSGESPQVGLDAAALAAAFPFHFALGADDRLRQVGPSLARLCPELRPGCALDGSLRVQRPPQPLRYATLAESAPSFIVLEMPARRLNLRGQTLLSAGVLLFLGSPWLTEPGQLARLGLDVTDFAPHDPQVDFLMLLQTKSVALEDARALAERLTEARDRLDEARRRAEAANAAKGEFLAVMSHEIRTPLGVIVGLSELLQGKLPKPLRMDFLRRLEVNARSLLKLVEDILDLARLEGHALRLHVGTFAPRDVAEEVCVALGARAEQRGLDLTMHVDRDVPAQVRGDEQRVRQILTNLVGNALKFTERGEVSLSLGVEEATDEARRLIWTVADTGPGIAPEHHEAIFERFVRIERAGESRGMGTGLGLAIARQLARAMGGDLTLQSESGRGAQFTLSMPCEGASAPPSPDPRFAGRDVAIVTERGALACGLLGQLGELGAHAFAVQDEEGLRGLPTTPAVLLLDDAVPPPLANAARALVDGSRLVLMASASTSGIPGAIHVMAKPPTRASLVDTLAAALGAGRRGDEGGRARAAPAPTRASILLIDDDVDTREVTTHLLTRLGHRVETAADGFIGFEKVRQNLYDLIITDLRMAGMSGEALIGRIRAFEAEAEREEAPVLALSADAVPQRQQAALAAGACAFLAKPVGSRSLAEAIVHYADARPTLLLVDDAESLRLLMRHYLHEPGRWRLAEAEDGERALEIAERRRVDLAFVDLELPGISGFEVAAALRARWLLPVIAVTGHDPGEVAQACAEAGFAAILPKPISRASLRAAVEKHLQGPARPACASPA